MMLSGSPSTPPPSRPSRSHRVEVGTPSDRTPPSPSTRHATTAAALFNDDRSPTRVGGGGGGTGGGSPMGQLALDLGCALALSPLSPPLSVPSVRNSEHSKSGRAPQVSKQARGFSRHATCDGRIDFPTSPTRGLKPMILEHPGMTSSRASGSSYAHWSNRSAKTTSAASKPKPTTVLAVPIRTDEQLTSLAKKRERNQISTRGLLVPTPDSAPSRHHAKNSDKEPRTSPRPSQAGLERKDCAVSPRVKQRKISGGSLHQSEQECPLPTMQTGQDAFKRISCVTLSDLLQGKYAGKVDNFVIIDCRFPYEFEGGHIQGAINVTTTSHLETLFFSEKRGQDTAIILHCEFSAQRAPKMALHLRNHDRNVNVEQYPKLDYPHIFIVQGGYKEFFSRFETHCEPKGYISMDDVRYRDELKQYLSQHKSEFKRCYSTGFLRT